MGPEERRPSAVDPVLPHAPTPPKPPPQLSGLQPIGAAVPSVAPTAHGERRESLGQVRPRAEGLGFRQHPFGEREGAANRDSGAGGLRSGGGRSEVRYVGEASGSGEVRAETLL